MDAWETYKVNPSSTMVDAVDNVKLEALVVTLETTVSGGPQ